MPEGIENGGTDYEDRKLYRHFFPFFPLLFFLSLLSFGLFPDLIVLRGHRLFEHVRKDTVLTLGEKRQGKKKQNQKPKKRKKCMAFVPHFSEGFLASCCCLYISGVG